MERKDLTARAMQITTTVAALQPQIAVLMQAVRFGIIGVEAVRLFFKSSGHDDEICDRIVADAKADVARWQNTTF